MKAYHFVGDKLRDGRPIPKDGEWLVYDGPVEMCESGLHFSRHPFDALKYAPGPTLCLVEVEDVVEEGEDKGVCRRRMIVKRVNMEKELRNFARAQALKVIHLWDAPDIVKKYLETGDEGLRDAAWVAAWDAARAAARAAAWDAARAAAGDAAWDAARTAAGDAAWAAAWDAARDAAWDAAGDEFKELVDTLMETR